MSPPTFLDVNVLIYAVGRPHPLKEPSAQVLMLAAERPEAFLTHAEVLQELLHRYLALRLWPAGGGDAFRHFAELMRERVEPVHAVDVEQGALLADTHPDLGARDLLHTAVMSRLGVRSIVSADAGFDHLPAVERLDPTDVGVWRDKLAPWGTKVSGEVDRCPRGEDPVLPPAGRGGAGRDHHHHPPRASYRSRCDRSRPTETRERSHRRPWGISSRSYSWRYHDQRAHRGRLEGLMTFRGGEA
jgi:predicted nucleic acid-binding protein